MDIRNLIETLEAGLQDPARGLPEELFLFVSRLTPMVNVDLLIKNPKNETLLTWREDAYYGPCWHIPGGIVRFKETAALRIRKVAASELGASVEFGKEPVAINELMAESRNTRGHFISLLYECSLASPLAPALEYKSGIPGKGEWAWFANCPADFIPSQKVYEKFIGAAA